MMVRAVENPPTADFDVSELVRPRKLMSSRAVSASKEEPPRPAALNGHKGSQWSFHLKR